MLIIVTSVCGKIPEKSIETMCMHTEYAFDTRRIPGDNVCGRKTTYTPAHHAQRVGVADGNAILV